MIPRFLSRIQPKPHRHLDRPAGPPNPFESYLLIICILQGFAVVFGYASPVSIEALLPTWLWFVWGFLLMTGGIGAVTGLFWPGNPVDAILIKRVGLIAAGGGTSAYGVALLLLGPIGFIAGTFNLAFAVACFVRCWQVTRSLDRFRDELATLHRALRQMGSEEQS